MIMGWTITKRLRLSLLQVMKLVAYCAVGSACVAPMWRLWRMGVVGGGTVQGLVSVALFEAIVVPLVWAGLSFILVRRGAWRDGLIFILLLWPVIVALTFAGWMLFAYTIPAYGKPHGTDAAAISVHAVAIAALVASAVFLSRRLWNGYQSIRRPDEAMPRTRLPAGR
jgi:hypothetical protein